MTVPACSKGKNAMNVVTGIVKFEPGAAPPDGATVYVRLLDTSLIDVAAETVAQQVFEDVLWSSLPRGGLEFCVQAACLHPRHRYEISVLVDCDSDGEISLGDYYTTQSYPVLTQGYPDRISVLVHEIR